MQGVWAFLKAGSISQSTLLGHWAVSAGEVCTGSPQAGPPQPLLQHHGLLEDTSRVAGYIGLDAIGLVSNTQELEPLLYRVLVGYLST